MGGQTLRGRTSRAAPAIQQPVTISLQEACSGTTRTLQVGNRRVDVTIPAGVRTGTKVRIQGAVPSGSGGSPSDLYLVIDIAEDPTFEPDGDDLHTHVTIDVFKAILGGEVEVRTCSGKVVLTIPAGTQPEQVFRVAGRGLPLLKRPEVLLATCTSTSRCRCRATHRQAEVPARRSRETKIMS